VHRPISNPPNPWQSVHTEWLDEPPQAELQIFEEEAKSALAENDSPDVGFRWSVNPYRGCYHACAYCYARTSHQYLGFGAGTDFDRKIVVKKNVHEALERDLSKRSWKRELIAFSGNTDCYQPLEASYELTRRCLAVCLEHRNPVCVITKGALIRRDVDLLSKLAQRASVHVSISIPFANDETGRKVEPGASAPAKRFETMRILSDAGIETGIGIAPLIPGLNDSDIPELLERARAAGATSAFLTPVRLSGEVLPVFRERIAEAFPERAKKIESAIREVRGGKMNESGFGLRHHGHGPRWQAIESLFQIHCKKLGFNRRERTKQEPTLRQTRLFDSETRPRDGGDDPASNSPSR
jgi:DNA repair photolyase